MSNVPSHRPLLACAAIALALSSALAQEDPDQALLSKYGVTPDAKGIAAYLQSFRSTQAKEQRIADLVRQLGHDDYRQRDQATTELIRIGEAARQAVQKALDSDDVEVSLRARRILDSLSAEGYALMRAALTVIKTRKLAGLTGNLLEALPEPSDQYARGLLVEALAATTPVGNAELLRKPVSDKAARGRAVAAAALGKLLGAGAIKDMQALLGDADDSVRLSAARALAELGERTCLPALGELLKAKDVNIRAEANAVLSALTGQQFGFAAYEEDPARSKSVEAWQQWIRQHGPTAKLTLPLGAAVVELGRTLVCDYGGKKVIEYDDAGKVTWELANLEGQPWGCAGLPNGHRLIALHSAGKVIEYDQNGKEVWRKEGLPAGPQSVERLENGNTLIACRDGGKVVEVKPNGDIVWEVGSLGGATSASRLPDGKTLVALQGGPHVFELDRDGKKTWSLKLDANNQTTAQRLPNGNTLICLVGSDSDQGKISEHTREGKEVWSFPCPRPNSAQRLANGNTLISGGQGVREVTPAGKIVWEKPFGGCGAARRY